MNYKLNLMIINKSIDQSFLFFLFRILLRSIWKQKMNIHLRKKGNKHSKMQQQQQQKMFSKLQSKMVFYIFEF